MTREQVTVSPSEMLPGDKLVKSFYTDFGVRRFIVSRKQPPTPAGHWAPRDREARTVGQRVRFTAPDGSGAVEFVTRTISDKRMTDFRFIFGSRDFSMYYDQGWTAEVWVP